MNGAYYYGVFWGGMPDLNFNNAEVRLAIEQVAAYWLRRGVDGFRLDAARHLIEDGPGEQQVNTPGTHAFWREFAAYVRKARPKRCWSARTGRPPTRSRASTAPSETVAGGDELP